MGITNGTKGAKASDLAGVLFNALGSSRGWHGRHIGRKRNEIGQGRVERLLWSDENSREAILAFRRPP